MAGEQDHIHKHDYHADEIAVHIGELDEQGELDIGYRKEVGHIARLNFSDEAIFSHKFNNQQKFNKVDYCEITYFCGHKYS